MVIFMTGVGTRTPNQALLTRYSQERIVAALGKAQLVAPSQAGGGAERIGADSVSHRA